MSEQNPRNGDRRNSSGIKRLFNWRRLYGRRHHIRREEDKEYHSCGKRQVGYHVDRYAPSLVYILLATIVLSCTDAFLTTHLLTLGAVEKNLLMDGLLQEDNKKFMGVKFILTSLGLLFLLIYHKFHIFDKIKVLHVIYGIFVFYLILILYELLLIFYII